MRAHAVFVLGNMGESAKFIIPDLIPLLKDEDYDVQSTAANALEQLGYKP
jgi:HEAT repeat protein